jgi:hypothetical protein
LFPDFFKSSLAGHHKNKKLSSSRNPPAWPHQGLGFSTKDILTVGVFSQRLGNFTQRFRGRNRMSLRKPSLFHPACVLLLHAEGKPKLERLEQRLSCSREQTQGEPEDQTMAKDDRDILETLKDELVFIEQGGYGRSVRTPWVPKSVFQDSLTCLNYGYPYRAHPCADCRLLDFVGQQDHSQTVPCHFIPLNDAGKTIEELELDGNELQTVNTVKKWLQGKINQIESERSKTFWENVD